MLFRKFLMFLYFSLVFSLFTQETAPIFNRVPANEKGIEELTKILSDPKIRIEEKQSAVDRLGIIAQIVYAEKMNIPPEKIYNPLLGALTPIVGEAHHHVLRINICRALGVFSYYDQGIENIIPALGRRLKDDKEVEDVKIEAARSLAKFQKHSATASTELIDVLVKELDRGPQPDNIRLTTAVIQSLGALGDKRAFVPLMRVIKSSFPTGLKKEAQASLESIKWN